MTIRRTFGWARAALLAFGLAAGTAAPLAGAADAVDAEAPAPTPVVFAAMPAANTGCPTQLSCGYQCVAKLASGFCTTLFEWRGGGSLGGVAIGPRLKVECHICECWYIAPGPAGSVFKRQVDLGCGASLEGLVVH